MRDLTPRPGQEPPALPRVVPPPDRTDLVRGIGLAALVFGGAAVLAAVLWWWAVDLPQYRMGPRGPFLDEIELAKQVGIDGWYTAVSAGAGLLAGSIVTNRLQRSPFFSVLVVGVGAALAAWLMRDVGLLLGPADPSVATVDMSPTDRIPAALRLTMPAAYLAWPITALLGAVAVLWSRDPDGAERR